MEDLNGVLANSIKKALAASASRDYETAQKCLIKAAECSLLLAKQSTGIKKEEYFSKYKEIKGMLESPNFKRTALSVPANRSYPVAEESEIKAPDNKSYKGAQSKNSDSLSPKWLNDYIGQPQAVTAVRDLIDAARLKNSSMPHLILYGSHGLGKTTFAHIIANEMHVGFTEINVSKINVAEMITILKKVKPRDIIFIDEIHTLPLIVAESVLYSAMQDGKITFNEGKGKFARTQELTLPPFTLIGATTEIGKLAKPFTQRAIQIRLEEYSDEVLGGIITNSFYKLGMKISAANGLYIAKRCRNNPRIANNTVRRISDKALVRYAAQNNLREAGSLSTPDAVRKLGIEVTENVIDSFFEENGIDEYGLENGDRELLRLIITRYNGGPVGLDTIAKVMNEANNVISQKYESYLIKRGMLRIDRDGRVVMPLAYKVLGLPVPETLAANTGNNSSAEEKKPKYDKRKIVVCKVADDLKCEKISDLITYPDSAGPRSETLDELFPDIAKEYEADPKHACVLELDFGEYKREIMCDSFLESRFATAMALSGYLQDIKAQALELPYVSQELANRKYFPDFFIKARDGRIAIIEMKNYEMVSYHLNIDKYEFLKRYCTEHGFGYAEVMKAYGSERYISVETIKNKPVNSDLERYVFDTIEQNGVRSGEGAFTALDFDEYKKAHRDTDISELYTLLLNNRKLKNVDRVGDSIKIILNR